MFIAEEVMGVETVEEVGSKPHDGGAPHPGEPADPPAAHDQRSPGTHEFLHLGAHDLKERMWMMGYSGMGYSGMG